MSFVIENEIIVLRKTGLNELDAIMAMEQEADTAAFIIPYKKDRHFQVFESTDEEHLCVVDKKTEELMGFLILAGLKNPNLSLELRRIVIQRKGRGMGRLCLQLVKKYCFTELLFHRLWLDVFTDNKRAIQLYTSEGFRLDGRLRDTILQGDQYRSLLILSILYHEYAPVR